MQGELLVYQWITNVSKNCFNIEAGDQEVVHLIFPP
jgi:hypothetical protein